MRAGGDGQAVSGHLVSLASSLKKTSLWFTVPPLSVYASPMLFVLSTPSAVPCPSFPLLQMPDSPTPAGSSDSSAKAQPLFWSQSFLG